MICRWGAYDLGNVIGVTALLQLTIFLTVIVGGTYFKEHKLSVKIVSTLILLAGAVFVILSAR